MTDGETHARTATELSVITEWTGYDVYNATAGFALDSAQCLVDWANIFLKKLMEIPSFENKDEVISYLKKTARPRDGGARVRVQVALTVRRA